MEEIKVKAFGKIAELLNNDEIHILKEGNIGAVRQNLISQFPELSTLSFRIAMNHEIVADECTLENCQELALLPPFSGG
jgi:sulfur-carrier protein